MLGKMINNAIVIYHTIKKQSTYSLWNKTLYSCAIDESNKFLCSVNCIVMWLRWLTFKNALINSLLPLILKQPVRMHHFICRRVLAHDLRMLQ